MNTIKGCWQTVLCAVVAVLCFAQTDWPAVSAAVIAQGTDGKTYLMLDERDVAALDALMASKDAEIKRLRDERKTDCGLI